VEAEDRLKRLYRGIEEDIVELDDLLRERAVEFKADSEKAQPAYDHAAIPVVLVRRLRMLGKPLTAETFADGISSTCQTSTMTTIPTP
jgi:hypothetical protein